MKILAIESSCDETAAAVVEDGRTVLSNVVYTQVALHAQYGGVVPEIASRKHVEKISAVAQQALEEAGLGLADVEGVAVTYAPGLIGALLTGIGFAKGLAYGLGVPLIPVHHLRGHIAACYISENPVEPPFLALVVSGGHSHIVRVDDYMDYTVLGRTRDDAAGEAYDKVARILGAGYPGGAAVEKLAKSGDPKAYRLPVTHFDDAPFDYSFSGLKTHVLNLVHRRRQAGEDVPAADIAASFNATVVKTLLDKFYLAAENTGLRTFVLAGGVAANSLLRREFVRRAQALQGRAHIPPMPLCGDNAAMIGAQGYYEWSAGHVAGCDLNGYPTMDISCNYGNAARPCTPEK